MSKEKQFEDLLSPSLRVSRPVAACSRCRLAKIKCDGKLPACTACERSGKTDSCSGASDDFAKGKERSYVAALESATEKLRRRIIETKRLQAADPDQLDSLATTSMLGPDDSLSPLTRASFSRVHRKEASDVDNLVGDFGFLSVNATSRDFFGFNDIMSFSRLLLAVSKTGEIPPGDTKSLPVRHSITASTEHYLDNIFVLLPFFSETDFIASISAVYADAGRFAKPTDHWVVRMVLAIEAAYASQKRGDSNYGIAQQHVGAALRYAEDVLHPGSIAGIQAIIFLVQYSLLDPYLFSSWHLIGFASRLMVDLGLHHELPAELSLKKDVSEMRRRVFYCVYALDRTISMALGRPFSFTDDSVSVPLPSAGQVVPTLDHRLRPQPQLFLRPLQPSLYLFDIRRVQSALYQESWASNRHEWPNLAGSAYTASVLKDIRSWLSSVPASLPKSLVTLFRLEALYSQIVAVSPSCHIPFIPERSRTLTFEYVIQYTDQLHLAIRNNECHGFFTTVDAHRVVFVGNQFLNAMWISFDDLLSGRLPSESPVSSPPSLNSPNRVLRPPSPSRPTSALENTIRAIRCLKTTSEILSYAGKRFGNQYASFHASFEHKSAATLNKLHAKKQELGTVQYISGGPTQVSPLRYEFGPPARLVGDSEPPIPHYFQHSPPKPNPYAVSNGPAGRAPPLSHSASFGAQSDFSLMPEGARPRRSYEFLGLGRPGQGDTHNVEGQSKWLA